MNLSEDRIAKFVQLTFLGMLAVLFLSALLVGGLGLGGCIGKMPVVIGSAAIGGNKAPGMVGVPGTTPAPGTNVTVPPGAPAPEALPQGLIGKIEAKVSGIEAGATKQLATVRDLFAGLFILGMLILGMLILGMLIIILVAGIVLHHNHKYHRRHNGQG